MQSEGDLGNKKTAGFLTADYICKGDRALFQ